MNSLKSIYKSPEIEKKLMAIYDARLKQWPVPYESIYIDTSYGRVHTIVSGPEKAPSVILLHASGLSAWSWLYNVGDLARYFRTYAIDTIGDAGKSRLNDPDIYPKDGYSLSKFYGEIADKFEIESSYVVGASQGGFIGTNFALFSPDRVKKLVLLGPMGYAGTGRTVIRIVLATIIPLKRIQDSTFHWAFGEDEGVQLAVQEWFQTVMTGVFPKQARPRTFSTEQLQNLQLPVLLVLGQRDGLVGNPERAKKVAQGISDVRTVVVNTGHAIGVEQPDKVNAFILDFLKQNAA